jgi:murein DD-endopeptidase MepM/ murein hydrolase activator NlpD
MRRVALAAIVLGAGFAIWRWVIGDDAEAPPPVSAPARTVAPAHPVASPTRPAAAPPPAASTADPLAPLGMRYARVTVAGPLETAFVTALGRDLGAPLTQVVTRTLVWWVSVPSDLRRGDVVEALFSERPGAEPLVFAVRFRSEKAGRTFEAHRFQEPGAPFARFYTRDGKELELRLQDAPLDDHEQVTSLIRDGRGHRGVDFRTPVGTPVKATFDAVVARRNWNFRSNGNCLELRERGGAGRTVYLLHLSEVSSDLAVGDRVARGQVVGRSGNTGHSYAPHLHYQVMSRAGRGLDPFANQRTFRRELPAAHRAGFDAEATRLAALLDHAATTASRP